MNLKIEEGSTELWHEGKFIASWRELHLNPNDICVIVGMLDAALACGKKAKADEIRLVLGCRQ